MVVTSVDKSVIRALESLTISVVEIISVVASSVPVEFELKKVLELFLLSLFFLGIKTANKIMAVNNAIPATIPIIKYVPFFPAGLSDFGIDVIIVSS